MDKYFVDRNRQDDPTESKRDDIVSPPDWDKLHDSDISKTKIKKDESVNIDINLILGGGKPPHGMMIKPKHEFDKDCDDKFGMPKMKSADDGFSKWPSHEDDDVGEKQDGDDLDWKSIAKQLLQSISMMDTHSDGYESGSESAEGALAAIDNETSRVLWGKQSDDNPMSSYQNANYGATTSNGMVMTNPAVTDNVAAYGKADPDNDGDVDFDSAGRFIDTGKDDPHGTNTQGTNKDDEPDWESLYKMLCEECGIDPEEEAEESNKPKEESPSVRPMIQEKKDQEPKDKKPETKPEGNAPKPMPKAVSKKPENIPVEGKNKVDKDPEDDKESEDIDDNYDKKGFPKARRR